MITSITASRTSAPHHDPSAKTIFGFWIYILTDCVLFASLFATYVVLQGNTWAGPTASELFNLPFVLTETMILLTSSFTAGLAVLSLRHHRKEQALAWLGATLLLGSAFLVLEISEFVKLIREGYGFDQSAFLSGFFTLVGTHGVHVMAGTLWGIVLGVQVLKARVPEASLRRFVCWSLFWHFLDIVWIFIFTFVYLMSVIA